MGRSPRNLGGHKIVGQGALAVAGLRTVSQGRSVVSLKPSIAARRSFGHRLIHCLADDSEWPESAAAEAVNDRVTVFSVPLPGSERTEGAR